ncbi:MAG: L-glutamate gamma-semialdehyde dehydrogenase [Cytophagaceae bacterium]|nr:L-glutamate gamma-semialdehyde dehydrogenase [Cytophagaceae bacterium]MDW8456828.1 L-glutamate gamma-semialdehyde dehydrogenase [Cytophagaceae bacterium]
MNLNNYNPQNEPVKDYAPGSEERTEVLDTIKKLKSSQVDIPMYIGEKEIFTTKKINISPPHEHAFLLGHFNEGDRPHVVEAIEACLRAKPQWEKTPVEKRAEIFLKAADLISGKYRATINAATMLGQGKNIHQAELDAACEMSDFLRFNVKFMLDIYSIQPASTKEIKNSMDYRPLEGFVFAITPFNFTAIAGNLPSAPAMLGNTVVWKPNYNQIYSANVLMKIFLEAGLPPGVINLIYVDGPVAGEVVFKHRDFAGLHFTGSTAVFRHLWQTIGQNLHLYKSYPKIVGEAGGKDFVLAHPSADLRQLCTALIRGAFEYQGQKCSAASRAYLPKSLWNDLATILLEDLKKIKIGTPEDFSNFMNAVIDEKAFDRIVRYIENAKKDPSVKLFFGGQHDKSKGYFIEPTVFIVSNPKHVIMEEEIFGPVLSIYIYNDDELDDVVHLIDNTSPYALTGAIMCQDETALAQLSDKLRYAAGNLYLNDKPTGAIVNQQPFGGSRASGTNDKAGSIFNMIHWVSPRTIKHNLCPPVHFEYPFMLQ